MGGAESFVNRQRGGGLSERFRSPLTVGDTPLTVGDTLLTVGDTLWTVGDALLWGEDGLFVTLL